MAEEEPRKTSKREWLTDIIGPYLSGWASRRAAELSVRRFVKETEDIL